MSDPLAIADDGSVTLATFSQRVAATLVDGLLVGLVSAIVVNVAIRTHSLSTRASVLTTLVCVVVVVTSGLYQVAMLATRSATLGNRAAGTMVVRSEDLDRPTPSAAVARFCVGSLAAGLAIAIAPLALYALAEDCWCLRDANRQTFHDKVARTVVVTTS
jgi:uncharacterized RDD family membrane protein YckC